MFADGVEGRAVAIVVGGWEGKGGKFNARQERTSHGNPMACSDFHPSPCISRYFHNGDTARYLRRDAPQAEGRQVQGQIQRGEPGASAHNVHGSLGRGLLRVEICHCRQNACDRTYDGCNS